MKPLNDRLLVVSYAFPPLKVAMAPCVAKTLTGIRQNGYAMDVICADVSEALLNCRDDSLAAYVADSFPHVERLIPIASPRYWITYFAMPKVTRSLAKILPLRALKNRLDAFPRWLNPDPMARLHITMLKALRKRLKHSPYQTILTFAPFHSVNPVMIRIKKEFPEVKWIAQFSDPWAYNPLEHNPAARRWALRHEPETARAADFIIHNSQTSLDLMVSNHGSTLLEKSSVIPHPFDAALYPSRPKHTRERLILRHTGTLFEDRSPESLFTAVHFLLNRRPDLADSFTIEFFGSVEPRMLESETARTLPPQMIRCMPNVSYVASLEAMYDADILLLIEADTKHNLFMPSKLSDYIGAGAPVLAIVPEGAARTTLDRLGGCWQASPADVDAIASALENIIDYVQRTPEPRDWCSEQAREEFAVARVGQHYASVLETLGIA